MLLAKQKFEEGIDSTKRIFNIYNHLKYNVYLEDEMLTDILRSQIVYSVSCIDRFVHELVRIGILEIFSGIRVSTPKFENQPFKAKTLMSIMTTLKSSVPPASSDDLPESIINKEIIDKLSFQSFQASDKIKDALSYISKEQNKMVYLAKKMNLTGANDNEKQQYLEQTFKLIIDRRNKIVHEADLNPINGKQNSIDKLMVEKNINFILSLGLAIYDMVTERNCYTV